MKLTNQKIEEIRRFADMGLSHQDIVARTGVGNGSVCRMAKDIFRKRKEYILKRNAEMIDLYLKGEKRGNVALRYGVSEGLIALLCKRMRKRNYYGENNP